MISPIHTQQIEGKSFGVPSVAGEVKGNRVFNRPSDDSADGRFGTQSRKGWRDEKVWQRCLDHYSRVVELRKSHEFTLKPLATAAYSFVHVSRRFAFDRD